MLLLDGFNIQGHSISIAASQKIKQSDLSGQSSQTDIASGGFKPVMLNVTAKYLFKEPEALRLLIQLMQKTDEFGNQKVFNISNLTAEAFNVRQVVFTDNFSIREDGQINLWHISFSLKEQGSVPAIKEQRKDFSSTPGAISGQGLSSNSNNVDEQPAAPLTTFEQVLSYLDSGIVKTEDRFGRFFSGDQEQDNS